MTKTGFYLPRAFDPSSGRMWFVRDSRIDFIHCILRFDSDLSFVIWDLFVICNLRFGI